MKQLGDLPRLGEGDRPEPFLERPGEQLRRGGVRAAARVQEQEVPLGPGRQEVQVIALLGEARETIATVPVYVPGQSDARRNISVLRSHHPFTRNRIAWISWIGETRRRIDVLSRPHTGADPRET